MAIMICRMKRMETPVPVSIQSLIAVSLQTLEPWHTHFKIILYTERYGRSHRVFPVIFPGDPTHGAF